MTLESYIVLIVIVVMIFALAKDAMRPGLVLFSVAVFFMAIGIITPNEMVAGFSNKGMLTVGILFLVSEGVRHSGIMNKMAEISLPKQKRSTSRMLLQLMLPISALSAFLNNTPVVIIFAPMIKKWAEKLKISPSKFLIPLSYATIFGGICTLIGTSTNLVVDGMMQEAGYKGLNMFELGKIGLIIALIGWLYIAFIGHRLLNNKEKDKPQNSRIDSKEYYFNLLVVPKSKYIGEVVRKGKMSENKNITIVSVERDNNTLLTQNERVILQENDKLLVCGFEENIESLLSLSGLEVITQGNLEKIMQSEDLQRIEAVLAPRFPGIGSTLDEFDFYNRFKGIVLAIHRNGSNITSSLNSERLRPGDSLIILADKEFVENWNDSKMFFLVSSKGEMEKPAKTYKIGWTLATLIIMIAGATIGQYLPTVKGNTPDMFFFAAVAAVMMAVLKIFPPKKYSKAISWDVLITIASAFAISKAMLNSGAAQNVAHLAINSVKQMGPTAVLAIIYLITMVFTEIITNNAAAAIAFPIALSAANQLGVDPKPFFIAICIAASASFSTPIGYQTNMIVQSIGNYKFKDFLRIGLPLNFLAFILSVVFIPLIWKF
ncbi:MAG TPA: SLC13 family permease [Prolixibacteraceae bacterium]|nr:SLC13 family permease [Prolixibacteraceae bacterium]